MHLSIYSTCLSLSVLYSFNERMINSLILKLTIQCFLLVSRVNILYILVNY